LVEYDVESGACKAAESVGKFACCVENFGDEGVVCVPEKNLEAEKSS
jgi:hypothetical protein